MERIQLDGWMREGGGGGMNEKEFFQSPVCGRQAECRYQKMSEADERVCIYTVILT